MITLLTVHNERYQPIADVTLPLMERYCKKNGYALHVGKYHEDPTRLESYGDRGKIALFNELYREDDIICFMDIDVVIMDSESLIEGIIQAGQPFAWTYDPNGPCSGFWVARCVPQTKLMFAAVAARAQQWGNVSARESFDPHAIALNFEPRGTSDQTTMARLMSVPPFASVLANCRPGKAFGHCYHSYAHYGWEAYADIGQYEPGDWLVTAPSIPLAQRVEILKSFATTAK